jgi:hypothetical protein
MDDQNQATQDTSQPNDGFTQVDPLESSSPENMSVQDAFFGQNEETAAPTEGQPAPTEAPPVEETTPSNDEKRFEYWQSRADKIANENAALKQQMQAQQNLAQQYQQSAPPNAQPAQEEFPPPPERPKKPSGFNRSEAYSDPDSSSAKYLDEVEDWRSEMDDYNAMKVEYNNAVVQERIQKYEDQQRQQQIMKQQYDARMKQVKEVNEYVQGHYGMNPEEAKEFIQSMSDPKSLSMDNLVQLYRLKKGTNAVPGNPTGKTGPSEAFQQTQRAQQVPSPMGVMPSTTGDTNRSDADQLMDSMINDFKNKNPW